MQPLSFPHITLQSVINAVIVAVGLFASTYAKTSPTPTTPTTPSVVVVQPSTQPAPVTQPAPPVVQPTVQPSIAQPDILSLIQELLKAIQATQTKPVSNLPSVGETIALTTDSTYYSSPNSMTSKSGNFTASTPLYVRLHSPDQKSVFVESNAHVRGWISTPTTYSIVPMVAVAKPIIRPFRPVPNVVGGVTNVDVSGVDLSGIVELNIGPDNNLEIDKSLERAEANLAKTLVTIWTPRFYCAACITCEKELLSTGRYRIRKQAWDGGGPLVEVVFNDNFSWKIWYPGLKVFEEKLKQQQTLHG